MSIENFETQLKNTDWFYEYAEGGEAWRRGRKSYHEALAVLRELDPVTRKVAIENFVPEQMREAIIKDLTPSGAV